MKGFKISGKLILFVVITTVCLAFAIKLYSMEPVTETSPKEKTVLKRATVQDVKPGAYGSRIKVFGEAAPRWTTTLRAQVKGEITYINKKLQPGEKLKAGEIILEIDKSEYLASVAQARLDLENARVNYLQAQRRADQAKSDWDRSGFKGTPSSALVFHGPQLSAAKAQVASAEKMLERALIELDHTRVKSPYAGLVIQRFADKGETVFEGDTIVEMASVGDSEIKVKLDAVQANAIGNWQEAAVEIVDPVTEKSWPGKIIRDGGMLDTKTRLRSFYIRPLEGKKEILPGMFVAALIHGKKIDNLMALPESALTRDGYVWYTDMDDKLRSIRARVAFYANGKVFIKNSENHDHMRIVITPVQTYISGTKVNPVNGKEG